MERTEMSAREVRAVEFLAGLDSALNTNEKYLEERMKGIPNCWRDYRLARKLIEKVLDGVYDTVPEKMLRHMKMMVEFGEIIIRQRAVVPQDYGHLISSADMKLLINAAMESKCAICMERGASVKGCKLRKVLMRIAPPEELVKDGSCNYQEVAHAHTLGEYI